MRLDSLDLEDFIKKLRSLGRGLSTLEGLQSIRIATPGGSTTNEVVDLLGTYLLEAGFRPESINLSMASFTSTRFIRSPNSGSPAPILRTITHPT